MPWFTLIATVDEISANGSLHWSESCVGTTLGSIDGLLDGMFVGSLLFEGFVLSNCVGPEVACRDGDGVGWWDSEGKPLR